MLRVIVGPFRERRNNKLFIERERKKNKSAYLSIIKVMAEIPIANTINIYLSIIGYVDFFLAPDFTRCSFCIKCKKTQGNTKKKTYTCATKKSNKLIYNKCLKKKQAGQSILDLDNLPPYIQTLPT